MMRIWYLVAAGVLVAASALARTSSVELESGQGTVALDSLPGQLQIIGVGYTRCPDICPTMLAQMKLLLRRLGPHAQRVKAVFVSVDYVHDDASGVSGYAKHFSPEILGLAGDKEQIERLASVYPVGVELSAEPGGDLVVNHSTDFLVLRHGEVVSILPSDLSPEVMAELIIDQLASVGIGNR